MAITFVQARRAQSHWRIALSGPPGSGKTYSALRIASGLGCQRIAVIESEKGRANKQAGKGVAFGVHRLPDHSPRTYCEALEAAAKSNIDCVIIDSLSHEWNGEQGALDMVAAIARNSDSGNEFAAWKAVTPEHAHFVDVLMEYPGHLIATMRSKKVYEMVETKNRAGRTVMQPREVGLKPVQREFVDYEFDLAGVLNLEHRWSITKSCCELYPRGAVVERPGVELGQRLAQWLYGERVEGASSPASTSAAVAAATVDPRVERHVVYDDEYGNGATSRQ